MRTLKELDYVEKRSTILMGSVLGTAYVGDGRTLEVVGSGNLVRFTLTGHPGCVDLDISNFAGNAAEWLKQNITEQAAAKPHG